MPISVGPGSSGAQTFATAADLAAHAADSTSIHGITDTSALAPKASPTFTGTVTLPGGGIFGTRMLNTTDENNYLFMGPSAEINNQSNDTFLSTICPANPASVETVGAGARGIGFNIGQWAVTATDGASALTRTGQWANIEHDFIQFQQTGGSATFNDVVSSRFRFSIPKSGVTIVDNKGIDFVVPNVNDVTGTVTTYTAINIPTMSGGGGINFYGIKFNNAPNKGSLASVSGHDLTLNTIGNNYVRIRSQGTDVLTTSATEINAYQNVLVNQSAAAGTFISRVYSGNAAADEPKFSLYKSGVVEWSTRIAPGVGASDLEWRKDAVTTASLTSGGLFTVTGGLDAGATGGLLIGATSRRKTIINNAASSPDDALQIKSAGSTGGWQGTIDLQVSYSGGAMSTGIRVAQLSGGTALGFYGATAVVKQTGVAVSAAGIHAALVNLGLIGA